jgi:hypothetical protein
MGVPIYLSEKARELFQDGTFSEIMALLEQDLKDEWASSPDALRRDSLYHELQALTRVNLKVRMLVDSLLFQRDS